MVVFYIAHRNGEPQESKHSAGFVLRGFSNAVIPEALLIPCQSTGTESWGFLLHILQRQGSSCLIVNPFNSSPFIAHCLDTRADLQHSELILCTYFVLIQTEETITSNRIGRHWDKHGTMRKSQHGFPKEKLCFTYLPKSSDMSIKR